MKTSVRAATIRFALLAASIAVPQAAMAQTDFDRADSRFGQIPTAAAPGGRVDAEPWLAEAGVRPGRLGPAGSRLVFIHNGQIYGGTAVRPRSSQNLLMLDVPEVTPSAFSLRFDTPASEVTFTVPALAAGPNGIIFPEFGAAAYARPQDTDDFTDPVLDRVYQPILRSFADVPARTFTLRASGGQGIREIMFVSDPQGEAAFRSILIEEISFRPMP